MKASSLTIEEVIFCEFFNNKIYFLKFDPLYKKLQKSEMEKNEENQQRNTNEEIKNNSEDNSVGEATADNNSNKIHPQLHQQRYYF